MSDEAPQPEPQTSPAPPPVAAASPAEALLERLIAVEVRWRSADRLSVEERAERYAADIGTLFDAVKYQADAIAKLSTQNLVLHQHVTKQREATALTRAVANASIEGDRITELAERRARRGART